MRKLAELRPIQKKYLYFFILGAFLCLGPVSCTTTDFVHGGQSFNFYSVADDIRLGQQTQDEIIAAMRKQHVPINDDPQQLARVSKIVSNITAVSHAPQLPYEVTIFHTNIVNAMAAPGGKIFFFTGLWEGKDRLVTDDDELAAVTAHEIAHVTCRHATKQMTRNLPVDLILAGGAAIAQSQGSDTAAAIIYSSYFVYHGLIVPKYSRTDEAEADRLGMIYMAKAGYNPEAAVRIWKRAMDEDKNPPAILGILSDHPSNQARYEELQKLLPEAMAIYRQAQEKQ